MTLSPEKKLGILLIENEPVDAEWVRRALAQEGKGLFELECVDRLSEGLVRLREKGIGLVILDLNLPDGFGLEVFKKIHSAAPHLPKVILTGSVQEEKIALEILTKGAQEYLFKGQIDARSFIRSLRYAIERKRAEEKIRLTELRYHRLFETSKDGILLLDADTGQITDANPFMVDLLGYSVEDFLGKKLWEIGVFKDIAASQTAFLELRTKEYIRYEDLPLETKDGRKIEVEFVSNVYLVDHTKVIQCNIRDITERRQADQKMQEATQIKADFISMVSHELRTPLAVVQESLNLLSDGTLGKLRSEQQEYLKLAESSIERLARLINDVLDYQKLEAGFFEFQKAPQDLNQLIREVMKEFLPIADKKGLELLTQLHKELPPVACDRDKMTQVLTNFLSNAMKFTEKGKIVVASERGDNWIRVSVQDEGPGISKEDQGKLFQTFSQLKMKGVRKPGGTGLGLAISKKIIETHNGRIGVDSVADRGSTFYFILPIEDRRAR